MANKNNTTKPTKTEAVQFAQSLRGQYILGQALAIASETLKKAEYPESSNISDMEFLGESLFQIGFLPTKMQGDIKDLQNAHSNEIDSLSK